MAAPGLAPALVTRAALDQAIKPGPAAVRAAELAPARETQPEVAPEVAGAALEEATNPVLALATLREQAPAINRAPAEAVGTKSRFGGKSRARQTLSPHGERVFLRLMATWAQSW
jgi:hypothetical protein